MRRYSALIAVIASSVGGLLDGCGNSQPVPVAPAPAEPEPKQPPPENTAAAGAPPSSPARPVFSNCVLHAGEAHSKQHQSFGPGRQPGATAKEASCSFNAECIARHGEETEGDGFVYLACTEGDCSCRLEPVTPPASAVTFEFRASCVTSDDAERLLVEHCLKGMHVVTSIKVD